MKFSPSFALHGLLILGSSFLPGRMAFAQDSQSSFRQYAVAAVCPEATKAGLEVLRKGGNAVDASVALALAMAVTWPEAGNIGGGGFMLVHRPDRPAECIEYRETAPLATNPTFYSRTDSTHTGKAVGVPGTLAGLYLAHKRHGKLPWPDLVQPALSLAQDGFAVYPGLARSLNGALKNHSKNRFPELHRVLGPQGGATEWKAGMRLVQPDLAKAMKLIRDQGPDAFYKGPLGQAIVDTVATSGGVMTMEDLGLYKAMVRKPLTGSFRGNQIIVPGPPSSGGFALLQMLGILNEFDLNGHSRNSKRNLHLITEASRLAYRDRARFVGDPEFTPPPHFLLEKAYVAMLAKKIHADRFLKESNLGEAIPFAHESEQTTHFSVMDGDGMAVSNTYTLEDSYGSGVIAKGFGFLLNNEMGDFNWVPGYTDDKGKIGTPPNLIAPGKRMLSSQTPVIVSKDGRAWIVSGSPGGRTIPNTVTQVILNLMAFDMSARDAVDAPRIHHQWMPAVLRAEKTDNEEFEKSIKALEAMGMKVTRSRQGDAHTLVRRLKDGPIEAAPDLRIQGDARGD